MDLEINAFPQLTVLRGMCVKLHAPRNETRSGSRKEPAGSVSEWIDSAVGGQLSVSAPEASVFHHHTPAFQGRNKLVDKLIFLRKAQTLSGKHLNPMG